MSTRMSTSATSPLSLDSDEPSKETGDKSSGSKAKGKGPAVEIDNETEAKLDDSQRDDTSADSLSSSINKKSHREYMLSFCLYCSPSRGDRVDFKKTDR